VFALHYFFKKSKHMKYLNRILRVCVLILFLLLAVAGMSISGVAVALNKDRKLFADEGSKIEMVEENQAEISEKEKLE
jgi:hypothetical protein